MFEGQCHSHGLDREEVLPGSAEEISVKGHGCSALGLERDL